VSRYWTPEEFDHLRTVGFALWLSHLEASLLTRSSHHTREAAASAAVPTPVISGA